jgi:ABC-type bacteriocin/lantibiotic exporter with double-glycine peptidase domain
MSLLPISHHQQDQQADCLAACAAMVLSYLQVSATYKTLIKRLRIGYAGAPFRNLRYLESLGVSVDIRQGRLDMLRLHLKKGIPPIVFVATQELSYWNEGTNHAVVVVGIDEKSIYLNDPHFADAPQSVSIAEFDLAWFEMEEYYALIELKRGLFGRLFARNS